MTYTSIENSNVMVSDDGKKIRLGLPKSEVFISKDITDTKDDQEFNIYNSGNIENDEIEGIYIGTNVYENFEGGKSTKTAVYAMSPLGVNFRICGMNRRALNIMCQECLDQFGLVSVRSGKLKDLGIIKMINPDFLTKECWLDDQGYILGSDSNINEGIYYYNMKIRAAIIQMMQSMITGQALVGAHDVWPIVEIDYKEVEDRL